MDQRAIFILAFVLIVLGLIVILQPGSISLGSVLLVLGFVLILVYAIGKPAA